jgi:antirestriction protein ArdC
MNNKIYQEITDKIIAQLTKGIIPWEQPWFGVLGARSFNTNEAYSFLNQLVLGGENGHFITWHQLNMLKGHLRKGSKARRVFFWNTFEKAEETDKGEKVIKKIPYLKTYTVFNANDCDGLPQRWASEKNNKPIESAEKITKDYLDREKIELKKNRSEAYYNVKDDFIALPDLANFKSSQGYYGTLLHEIIHSTGSQKRLGRFKANDTSSPFGSPNYSREELVAEIGSSFLLHHLGISNSKTLEQNAAYIQNWIQALNNDVSLIAIAAGRAEKAVQFVMGEKK